MPLQHKYDTRNGRKSQGEFGRKVKIFPPFLWVFYRKSAKRRRRRKKRADFEAGPRFAGAQRRESGWANGEQNRGPWESVPLRTGNGGYGLPRILRMLAMTGHPPPSQKHTRRGISPPRRAYGFIGQVQRCQRRKRIGAQHLLCTPLCQPSPVTCVPGRRDTSSKSLRFIRRTPRVLVPPTAHFARGASLAPAPLP